MTRLFAGTPFDRPPHCERCDQPESECVCPPVAVPAQRFLPPHHQTARLAVEKRKRGKTVTVIRGLSPEETDFPALLSLLKTLCGAGGSIDGNEMQIQGNHCDRIRAELKKLGYRIQ